MSQKPSIPKGTRDFGPEEMSRREFIFDTLRTVFRKYGFQPIETPSMENLSVLTGKYGEEGDRLIFKILNSGDYLRKAGDIDLKADGAARDLLPRISEKALRYDLTVPFARYVVMNQHNLNFPFRRYQIQPVWRADRPQKGRYREFYQCDCDVIGSDALVNDAELVAIYDEAFHTLGFPGVKILLNNRKILAGIAEVAGAREQLVDICVAIDKLDKIGEEKVRGELEQRGIQEAAQNDIFRIISFEGSPLEKIDFLREAFQDSPEGSKGVAEMAEVFGLLRHFNLKGSQVELDLKLARGLNYYTGTIYEVKALDIEYGSIGGGGRYDDLTGVFGLSGLSGVGISFGADRIYDVMSLQGLFPEEQLTGTKVVLMNFGGEAFHTSLGLLTRLRAAGIPAEIYPDADKMKKQFRFADKRNAEYAISIGSQEREQGMVRLKNLASGEEQLLDHDALLEHLTTR